MEEKTGTIVLSDENGVETEFEIITRLVIEDTNKEYVVVIPVDGDEDVDPIALRIEETEEGDFLFSPIEDDEEFEMVSEAFDLANIDEE